MMKPIWTLFAKPLLVCDMAIFTYLLTLIGVHFVGNTSNLISATNRRSPRNNLDEIELCEFINQEYHRHVESRKRTASMDVCMDSPTHNNKRAKYL